MIINHKIFPIIQLKKKPTKIVLEILSVKIEKKSVTIFLIGKKKVCEIKTVCAQNHLYNFQDIKQSQCLSLEGLGRHNDDLTTL